VQALNRLGGSEAHSTLETLANDPVEPVAQEAKLFEMSLIAANGTAQNDGAFHTTGYARRNISVNRLLEQSSRLAPKTTTSKARF